ncbi:PEP-CTERM sorting domain-containing protein [Alteromonas sp. S167]|uniref:PEP-CTERM sorting domain-containing protein n=1 Tax=Alteromonas sp. S167 TaxID=3117402 RepID=UPI002FE13ADF
MKKLFLMLVAAVSFNANAALISLTTDKNVYNVGETVTVTVSLTGLLVGADQSKFSAYVTAFSFDTTLLQYVDGSLESLMPFGGSTPTSIPMVLPNFLIETFSGSVTGNNVSAQSIGGIGSSAPQFGGNTVALYTVEFIARTLGDNVTPFTFLQSDFSDAFDPSVQSTSADTRTASFSVAEVPAPSTLLLSLLALAGVAVARSRKQG